MFSDDSSCGGRETRGHFTEEEGRLMWGCCRKTCDMESRMGLHNFTSQSTGLIDGLEERECKHDAGFLGWRRVVLHSLR